MDERSPASTTAGRSTASTRTRATSRSATTPRRAAVLLLALRRSRRRAVRHVLLLGPRLELAQPPLHDVRHVGRRHAQRPVLPRDRRVAAVADHPRPPRGRGRRVEDLQLQRRRRHPHREDRQLGDLLEPLGERPADVGLAGGLLAGLPRRHAARRVVADPRRHADQRRAPAGGRDDRDAPAAAAHRARCARRRSGCARRICSPTTSTAGSSTTSRRRRSTRSVSASACRCG